LPRSFGIASGGIPRLGEGRGGKAWVRRNTIQLMEMIIEADDIPVDVDHVFASIIEPGAPLPRWRGEPAPPPSPPTGGGGRESDPWAEWRLTEQGPRGP